MNYRKYYNHISYYDISCNYFLLIKLIVVDFMNVIYIFKRGYHFPITGTIPKVNIRICEFDGPEFWRMNLMGYVIWCW